MTYALRTIDTVAELAADLNRKIAEGATFCHEGYTVATFHVRPHGWAADNAPLAWGIVPRWHYPDRPDLGEFGGSFMPLREAFSLVEKGHP